MKNPHLQLHLTKILVILNTQWLIILNKFDEDLTKIVDFLLLVYFWFSVIFMNQSLVRGHSQSA